ncbi:MAG: alanine racemase [Deltaproteobacteria bacterium]|nr:alanine racemase [Deltaproteobacteria bacterium]
MNRISATALLLLFLLLFSTLMSCGGDTVTQSVRPLGFWPTSGSFEGEQLVFVEVQGHSTALGRSSIRCRFGLEAPVQGWFDEKSRHYICRVPPHSRPEPVSLAVILDGREFRMDEPYVYTTHGKYDAPVTEIHVSRLQERVEWVREKIPKSVKLCAVLKNGNPPGWLGEAMAAATRVDYFCVPSVQAGIALRRAGVDTRILVMYLTDASYLPLLMHYELEPAAFSLSWVREVDRQLEKTDGQLDVHLWIDTGIAREGVLPSEALPVARAIHQSPHLHLQGIATHFCCLDDEDLPELEEKNLENQTTLQKHLFDQVVQAIRAEGIGLDAILHATSSEGLEYGLTPIYYDMLRIGTMLFKNPDPERRNYSWSTRILQTKTIPEGWCLNYGCEESFEEDTPVGLVVHIPDEEVIYYVRGQAVEKLLDHEYVVVLDLSELPDVEAGEEVTMVFDADDSPLHTNYSAPVTLVDDAVDADPR